MGRFWFAVASAVGLLLCAGLPACAKPPASQPASNPVGVEGATVLPLERGGDSLFAKVRIGDVDAGRFLISLSGSRIVVNTAVAQRLKLPLVRGSWGHDAATLDSFLARVDGMRLGAVQVRPRLAVATDMKDWGPSYGGARFSGSLGWAFLSEYAFTIDFHAATLTLYDPGRFVPPAAPASEESIWLVNGVPAVRGRLNDAYSSWFTLDPRTTSSFLLYKPFFDSHMEIFDQGGLPNAGVGGQVLSRFDSFSALGQTQRPAFGLWERITSTPPPVPSGKALQPTLAGAIGGPLLRDLRITFDVGPKRMWVEHVKAGEPVPADRPAGPEARDLAGITALMRDVEAGHHDGVKASIKAGADVNAADNLGRTSLMRACESCDAAIVDLLIKQGARIDAADGGGRTALMRAATGRHGDVAGTLIAAGAQVNLGDQEGRTALDYAASANQPKIVELLIAHGAEMNHKTVDGSTALREAIDWGSDAALEALLRNHASLSDQAALKDAVTYNRFEAARLLIQGGADVNGKGPDGRTPLTWAGAEDVARVLLAAGADPSAKSREGKTALDYALDSNYLTAANLIYEAIHRKDQGNRGPAGTIEVVTQRGRNRLFMPVSFGDKQAGWMLLDTGAEGLVVDAKYADQSHFPTLKQGVQAREAMGTFRSNVVEMPKFTVGGIEMGPKLANTADLGVLQSQLGGLPVIAAGTPFGGDDAYTLDYIAGKIEIHRGPVAPARGESSFPIRRVLSRTSIEAQVGDDRVYLGIDTGAPGQLFLFPPYCRLRPELTAQARGMRWNPGRGNGIGQSTFLPVKDVQLFGLKSEALLAEVPLEAPFSADDQRGIIGDDLLAGRRLTLDPARQRGWINTMPGDASLDATIDRLSRESANDLLGTTPIMRAVYDGRLDTVKSLLDRGADPNIADKSGETPLLAACKARNQAIALLLLNRGAKAASAAVVWATACQLPDVLHRLLVSNAGKITKDDLGQALLVSAECGGQPCADLLLAAGASPNWIPPADHITALMFAARNGNSALAESLIAHGADVEAANADGMTPLMFAAEQNHADLIRTLLSHGAHVDARTTNNRTALMFAAGHLGSQAITSLLLGGADPGLTDAISLTAMDYAADEERFENTEMLYFAQNGKRRE